jgi:hypothetical protein
VVVVVVVVVVSLFITGDIPLKSQIQLQLVVIP